MKEARQINKAKRAKRAPKQGEVVKILMIEDDPEIIESVSLAFQMRWPEANLVSTYLGREGIELANREAPDIIILDLGLPDVSGFEVLREIRLFSTVPIIILTATSDKSYTVRALEWGADDYVVKPFEHLKFLARVKSLAGRESQPPRSSRLAVPDDRKPWTRRPGRLPAGGSVENV